MRRRRRSRSETRTTVERRLLCRLRRSFAASVTRPISRCLIRRLPPSIVVPVAHLRHPSSTGGILRSFAVPFAHARHPAPGVSSFAHLPRPAVGFLCRRLVFFPVAHFPLQSLADLS